MGFNLEQEIQSDQVEQDWDFMGDLGDPAWRKMGDWPCDGFTYNLVF